MSEEEVGRHDEEEELPKRRRSEKQQRRRELEDIRTVMSTPGGRRFVFRLLSNIYQTTIRQDAHMTAYAAGKHDNALFILAEVSVADLKAKQLMEREAIGTEEENVRPS